MIKEMGELRDFMASCQSEMPDSMNLQNGLSAVSLIDAKSAHS